MRSGGFERFECLSLESEWRSEWGDRMGLTTGRDCSLDSNSDVLQYMGQNLVSSAEDGVSVRGLPTDSATTESHDLNVYQSIEPSEMQPFLSPGFA